jgi:hypothetical protein
MMNVNQQKNSPGLAKHVTLSNVKLMHVNMHLHACETARLAWNTFMIMVDHVWWWWCLSMISSPHCGIRCPVFWSCCPLHVVHYMLSTTCCPLHVVTCIGMACARHVSGGTSKRTHKIVHSLLSTTCCPLHVVHSNLSTTWCPLHVLHYMLSTICCPLHNVHYMLCRHLHVLRTSCVRRQITEDTTLSTTCCPFHVVHYMLTCPLHVVHYMLSTACCPLHNVHYMFCRLWNVLRTSCVRRQITEDTLHCPLHVVH